MVFPQDRAFRQRFFRPKKLIQAFTFTPFPQTCDMSCRAMTFSKWLKRLVWIGMGMIVALGVLLTFAIERIGVPPRILGPYFESRGEGHNEFIAGLSRWIGRTLIQFDRGDSIAQSSSSFTIGAQVADAAKSLSPLTLVHVTSVEEMEEAMMHARAGVTIVLSPGIYRFRTRPLTATYPGTEAHPITVRAEKLNTVFIEFSGIEGFRVEAPHWIFENLNIRGVCDQHSHSACEHAFHIVGKGSYFVARNNRVTDFNAHVKVNGLGGEFPDHGLIERNTFTNNDMRQTTNPVTPIDLVGASHWVIRGNLISDFAKAQGNRTSYGAFVKGGGTDNRLEQNVVLCEAKLKDIPGKRVGLSLGGGGTGKSFCRDRRCITEQERGLIQSNLIANCSDDGIYVNRSAASVIAHNTLVDTGGIVVRFAESSADVRGNIVDGTIRGRDGALLREDDNLYTPLTNLYLGLHPQHELFKPGAALDLRWATEPPRRDVIADIPDLCAMKRPGKPVYGAFEDFSSCLHNTGLESR